MTVARITSDKVATPHQMIIIILAFVVAFCGPLGVYFDTARSIVTIWNTSDTFAHGYIIFPISAWLIWRRRQFLAQMSPTPFSPAIALLVVCGFTWLLADLGGVQVVKQYAMVAMIPSTLLLMLGWKMTFSMAFPLLFLMLSVPFGEIFIDPLIHFTADFTFAAIEMTGIPIVRNGTHFELPTGSWAVVEACSGVRYLIASLTLGSLYAYLNYRSGMKQVLFILFSIVVPIIANGVRAFMIVMIGHFSGMTLAVGVDHIIYGWVFFGIVIFLMFWVGSFWRDDVEEHAPLQSNAIAAVTSPVSTKNVSTFAVVAVISMGCWPIYSSYVHHAVLNPTIPQLESFRGNWKEVAPFNTWKPSFNPANAELTRYFESTGKNVGIHILFYRNQRPGMSLITSSNKLVNDKEVFWQKIGASSRKESIANNALSVRETMLLSASGPMLVWQWYWLDGQVTASDYVGKILQAKEKLLMQGDDGAAILVFAPYTTHPDEARHAMRRFVADNGAALEATLLENKKQ